MVIDHLGQIAKNFTHELQMGEEGKKTSFPFIKNTLTSTIHVKNEEKFQAMVIGGTVFKSSVMIKDQSGLQILKTKEEIAPIFTTKEVFLEFISSKIENGIDKIGLNFAFPMDPVFENGKLDGKFLFPTKEHKFEGLVGEVIGETIEKYVLEKENRKILVSVANDTVCLLLSGLINYTPSELSAGIVGTGFNMALFLDETTCVNLEAANFNKFTQSREGKIIDSESERKGSALFEKEISGAYLFKHFNLILKERGIDFPEIKNSKELDVISRSKNEKVSHIARSVLKNSAELFACAAAGFLNFKDRNLNFVMQGSLFWNGFNYEKTVEETVKKLSPHKARFIHIDHSDILGAAKLIA